MAPDDQHFVLSSLPPSPTEKRLALAVVLVLVICFFITAGPLSSIQLARIDAFIPAYASALFVNDLITAALLFAQFSILRSRALLALSSGYLFTALIVILWMLTFPGVFAPGGLLGAGLQTTTYLYAFWHAGFPLFVIAYALLKDADSAKRRRKGSVSAVILSSIAVIAGVSAVTFFVIAADPVIPRLMLDPVHLSLSSWEYAAGSMALLNVVAVIVLWIRRRSVLDLWLMVVLCAFVIEVILISFPVPARFTFGWYAGRIYGALSASLLLLVLLYETTWLYGHLRTQRAEEWLRTVQAEIARVSRVTTLGQLTASIAHEVKQPMASARNNARAALNFLEMQPPDLGEVREALGCIVGDADRAGDIIDRIRDQIKKAPPRKARFDLNQTINEVLVLVRGAITKNGVSLQTRLAEGMLPVQGDRVQLQQVVLNLVLNAVEAMSSIEAGARELLICTELSQRDGVLVSLRDSGPGIDPEDLERVFEAFYTTKSGGVGMGLSICRSIIDAHGGRLRADVNKPRGAVFQFTLPSTDYELVNSLPAARQTGEA